MSVIVHSTRAIGRHQRNFVAGEGVHRAVLDQAAVTPDQIALIAGDHQLTYSELVSDASTLAHGLRRMGVSEHDCVAVRLPRNADLPVAILGVLLAGATYVPIEPSIPHRRLANILRQCLCSVLIDDAADDATDGTHRAARLKSLRSVAPVELRSLGLDGSIDDIHGEPLTSRLAYVMFTSGSTGEPKGVAMPHAPLHRLLKWQNSQSNGGHPPRTLQFASIGFDVSFQEIFSTWSRGGTLVMADATTRKDPAALLQLILDRQIQRVFISAAVLRHLCRAAGRRGVFPPTLSEIITAGDVLRVTDTVRHFFSHLPDCRLQNQYGPTETHVVTAHDVDPLASFPADCPPIGHPLPGVAAYLVDTEQRLVDNGHVGEIWIGGTQLADGYFEQPLLTSRRFRPDPFLESGRIYRTGDMARRLPDGTLEFLGRADEQVKIRGYRVEPAEVARALQSHEWVDDAHVSAVEIGIDKQLVATVTCRDDRPLCESAIARHAAKILPDFMVPSRIRVVDRMPLTANGKLDTRRLACQFTGHQPARSPYTHQPRKNDLVSAESAIRRLWQGLLGVQRVDRTDSFFELGGDSLRAMELVDRIERCWETPVSIAEFMTDPTIDYLARRVCGIAGIKSDPLWVPMKQGGQRAPFFCAPPAGGNALVYLPLARGWVLDRPFFACRYPDDELISGNLTRLAAHLIEAMRDQFPTGPYSLGGWSLGGSVAYEMACQLMENGQKVERLVLIDTGVLYSLAVMRAVVPEGCGLYQTLRMSDEDKLRRLARPFEARGLVPSHLPDGQKVRLVDTVLRNSCALWDFRPRCFRGRMHLIVGREALTDTRYDPYVEWQQFADEVERHFVDGNHLSLMDKSNRDSLLQGLARCLEPAPAQNVIPPPHGPFFRDTEATYASHERRTSHGCLG